MAAAVSTAPEKLVTTYLEMTNRHAFRPSYMHLDGVSITRIERPDVHFYRFLYGDVGAQWRWRDRLLMSDDELYSVLASHQTTVYVLYVHGVPAGYVELYQDGEATEIAYFGLRPGYMGRGLGKHLLSFGIAQAWAGGARRVWLHTCNLDSPHALDNYLKRGFRIVEVHEAPMPARYLS